MNARQSTVLTSCFILAAVLTWGNAEVKIISARFAAANCFVVTWTERSNNSQQFYLAVGKNHICSDFLVQSTVSSMQQVHVFWTVSFNISYKYSVCTLPVDGNGNWIRHDVSVDIPMHVDRYPPVILDVKDPIRDHREYKPNPKIIVLGDEIEILCHAVGSQPMQITWYHNDQEIYFSNDRSVELAKNGSLMLTVERDDHDAGKYYCKASNLYGSVRGHAVQLIFARLQKFPDVQGPNEIKHNIGEGVSLPCRPPEAIPPPDILWYTLDSKDEPQRVSIDDHQRVTIALDGSLIFVSLRPQDRGRYICEAENFYVRTAEGMHGHIDLKINEGVNAEYVQPVLLHRHERQPAMVGQEFTLQCIFQGRPLPVIAWYKDNVLLAASEKYIFISANQTLTITNITSSDVGRYVCVGSNRHGSASSDFTVAVQAEPELRAPLTSVNVSEGQEAEFHCIVFAMPPAIIIWKFNDKIIQDNTKWKISTDGSVLTAKDVKPSDIGTVQCTAFNFYGNLTTSAYLRVLKPTRILRTVPIEVSMYSVRIMCEAETDITTNLSIIWYASNRERIGGIHTSTKGVKLESDQVLFVNLTVMAEEATTGSGSYHTKFICIASNNVNEDQEIIDVYSHMEPLLLAQQQSKDNLAVNRASNDVNNDEEIDIHPNRTVFMQEVRSESIPFGNFIVMGIVITTICCVIIIIVILTMWFTRWRKFPPNDMTNELIQMQFTQTLPSSLRSSGNVYKTIDSKTGTMQRSLKIRKLLGDVLIERTLVQLKQLVGRGEFGRVYLGCVLDTKTNKMNDVAVKTLRYKPDETEMVDLFLREALLMKDFQHENVLGLVGVCIDADGSPMVLLPFMPNGDLRTYIQNPDRDLTILDLMKMSHQVARGMMYLASKRFVHRDLAARNCMVDEWGTVKVADFGLSRDLFTRDYYRADDYKRPLPVRWMAPECLQQGFFTTASDVWSFGVLLWEMMTRGATPYEDVDNQDIPRFIENGNRLSAPAYCPDIVYMIMLKCWHLMPQDRPTFDELVLELGAINCRARSGSFSISKKLYMNVASLRSVRPMYRQSSVPAEHRLSCGINI